MKSIGNKISAYLPLMGVSGQTSAVVSTNWLSSSAVMPRSGMTLLCTSIMFCIVCTRTMDASSSDIYLRWFSQFIIRLYVICFDLAKTCNIIFHPFTCSVLLSNFLLSWMFDALTLYTFDDFIEIFK